MMEKKKKKKFRKKLKKKKNLNRFLKHKIVMIVV